ncbi:MAG TPA: 50S ribosomal protein L9 [Bacteroidales bacterium]|nr:50S ribosomal protein L9 [Bacteroidales bacterium]HRZ77975.1 50S ribosomal protein L9 [Bacteroidales bacterium]
MEVILKQDVLSLGYKDDIVNVKDGYARNYLIPQGLAMLATPSNRKMVTETQRQRAFKEEKIRKEAEALQKALESVNVRIGAKAATTGRIFGSVTNVQIADAIKDQYNYEIDRKKIHVDGDHIKELGSYKATVNIYKEIKAEITFEVFEE